MVFRVAKEGRGGCQERHRIRRAIKRNTNRYTTFRPERRFAPLFSGSFRLYTGEMPRHLLLTLAGIAVFALGATQTTLAHPPHSAAQPVVLPTRAAPPPEKSEYTYETVSAYADSWEYAIRWGEGKISIYDETGIIEESPKILELLNANLGRTKLMLTNQEKAQIRVKWVDELPAPYANACATTQNTLKSSGVEYDFAIIRFRRENRCMGKNKSDADLLMMHELGHALGFAKHAKEDDVMSTHDPVWGKNEVNLLTLQHFLAGLYSLSPGQKIPGNTRMPEPAARMNVYHAPMEAKGPVYAVTPTERLPESRPLASTPRSRKIEKRLPDGTLTVEFLPLEPTSVNTNSSGAPILTPPGEIMTPRKATVSSGMDRIIEINSKTMKKGLSRPMETIEPGR